jgi:stage V sporulation protein SpoVS
MGDRKNLPECEDIALRAFMLSILKKHPMKKISLRAFKRKHRADAVRAIGLDRNCHLSANQWPHSWKELISTPGLKVVSWDTDKDSKIQTPVYQWVGQDNNNMKGKGRMQDLQVLTKLTDSQRNAVAKALAGVVHAAGRIEKKEAWEAAFQQVGFRVKGRAVGPICGLTSRYLTKVGEDAAVVSSRDGGHFEIGVSRYARRKERTGSRRESKEVVEKPDRTLGIGDVQIKFPPGGSLQIDDDVEIVGTTRDGGSVRLKLKNLTLTFLGLLVLLGIVIASSGAL